MRLMLSREPERRKEPPVHPNCKCGMKDKPKHEDFLDALLYGLFGGSVGHIELTGKRNSKTDEEIKEGNGYTEVHITGNNVNPIEVREYIERELKDRLAMVL